MELKSFNNFKSSLAIPVKGGIQFKSRIKVLIKFSKLLCKRGIQLLHTRVHNKIESWDWKRSNAQLHSNQKHKVKCSVTGLHVGKKDLKLVTFYHIIFI